MNKQMIIILFDGTQFTVNVENQCQYFDIVEATFNPSGECLDLLMFWFNSSPVYVPFTDIKSIDFVR